MAGLLHQKVFYHALVLGLLHGPRVGLPHVHVVAGKYQLNYNIKLYTVCPYTHVIIITEGTRLKETHEWKVTNVSTTRLSTFKKKGLVL